jgi:hypothetical protein
MPASPPVRSARFVQLLAAGLIDSFGLMFGWTIFSLLILETHGLAGLGACNAAMLVGVALSAPATAWLSRRLDGMALLVSTSSVEAVLRVSSFALLLAGAPVVVLVAVVVVMNVAGYTTHAGMRAEVSMAGRPGQVPSEEQAATAMTTYVVALKAVDAAGMAMAALLAGDPPGTAGGLLVAVAIFYGASQLPIWLVAGGARVSKAPRWRQSTGRPSRRTRRTWMPLVAGGLIMLIGSGPALLAVGLAAELHGSRWVAGSALAFTLGALLAPTAVALLSRIRLPATVTWPGLGAGMLLGWLTAPIHPAGLLVAQLLGGLCLAAFVGNMDAQIAARHAKGQLTANLAASDAVRALGSAAAVAALPAFVGTRSMAAYSGVVGTLLLAATLLAAAGHAWAQLLPARASLAGGPPPTTPQAGPLRPGVRLAPVVQASFRSLSPPTPWRWPPWQPARPAATPGLPSALTSQPTTGGEHAQKPTIVPLPTGPGTGRTTSSSSPAGPGFELDPRRAV